MTAKCGSLMTYARVERQKADRELRRVEPDALAEQPRERKEHERRAADEHELREPRAEGGGLRNFVVTIRS